MQPGVAIQNTLTGMPDFPGDRHAVTVSPGGPGKLIDCMKCIACGWSVMNGAKQAQILEIAANLERLCIEYDCYGRVSPQGSERRATWAQFKAQIEALRGMA